MSEESLIIELDARTAQLDAKLKATNKRLDDLGLTTEKTDSKLKTLSKTASAVGSALVKTTTTALALGAAIAAMTLKAASGRKELEQFARQAKTTEENFQALSFATNQFGVNAEQIADISKDISDRVGEFSAAGTGTFQDYADVMKLTKEEARAVAVEFQSLSSEQVIGQMVSNMEEAGTTGAQMTFVLESMGNDLSKLVPLFSDNSKELTKLKGRFNDVNSSLQITSGQAEKLKEVSTSFDLMTSSLGNSATAISATLAPVMTDFFNDIISVVPDATQSIIDFTNSFLDAENITSIAAINKEIISSQEQIAEKTELIANTNGRNQRVQRLLLDEEQERLTALEAQLEVLQEQETLADAKRMKGGEIGGATGGDGGSGTGDQLQAIEDRFKSEELLLQEKLERELEIVGDNNELRLELEAEFQENLMQIELKAEERKRKALDDEKKRLDKLDKDKKKQGKIDDKISKENEKRDNDLANNSIALAGMVFEDNKAVSAGGALVNTAMGVTKALSTQDYAGAALTAVMGAAQISTILGASKGGGGSVSAPTAPQSQPQQQDFQGDTASLDFSDATEGGSSVQRIIISTEDGTDLFDGIASGLQEREIRNA